MTILQKKICIWHNWMAVKDEAGFKTLENGLMMFTTKELYSKRLSLCVYKNKTNKNTADKCIKIYYVS